ncbi:DUF3990 domain-containing protein [uncultured Victivallis sp.]|uniref:DUF3990 domain-containing protein n=1 Tax=uncultured Victivallis sp. TaxID=354118 RepID=UPI0025940175|nr:DUF3990 domain-containing protein [uncultured Victivallis sp.]
MIVYHGGYCEIRTPEIKPAWNHKDFGSGFYCTELLPQAERWSRRFDTPVVSAYDYTPNPELDILAFDRMTEEWLDFIVACRNGKPHSHDIVTGAMANDQIWNYVADFISGILTREQFWVLAKFKHPTHQIAFCSEKALASLKFQNSWEVAR